MLTAAFLTVAFTPCGMPVVEKDITQAEFDGDTIAFRLEQEETLALTKDCYIQLNWLLSDGTRGATKPLHIGIDCNQKDETI